MVESGQSGSNNTVSDDSNLGKNKKKKSRPMKIVLEYLRDEKVQSVLKEGEVRIVARKQNKETLTDIIEEFAPKLENGGVIDNYVSQTMRAGWRHILRGKFRSIDYVLKKKYDQKYKYSPFCNNVPQVHSSQERQANPAVRRSW
jgi:hypothetical protein